MPTLGRLVGATGPVNPIGPVTVNPNLGQPAQANVKKSSDQRFRSFAERYIIARAHLFRVPMNEHAEDQWMCIQDAKRCYAMIERVGRSIEPEEGVFYGRYDTQHPAVPPNYDPHVPGAVWNDNGKLRVSIG